MVSLENSGKLYANLDALAMALPVMRVSRPYELCRCSGTFRWCLCVVDSRSVDHPSAECGFDRTVGVFREAFDEDLRNPHMLDTLEGIGPLTKKIACVHVVVKRTHAAIWCIPATVAAGECVQVGRHGQ